jgi:hypothetical protein
MMAPYLVNGTLVTGDGQWVWMETGDLLGKKLSITAELGEDVEMMQLAISPKEGDITCVGAVSMNIEIRDGFWVGTYRVEYDEQFFDQQYSTPCKEISLGRYDRSISISLEIRKERKPYLYLKAGDLEIWRYDLPRDATCTWLGLGQYDPSFGVRWKEIELCPSNGTSCPFPTVNKIGSKNDVENDVKKPSKELTIPRVPVQLDLPVLQIDQLSIAIDEAVHMIRKYMFHRENIQIVLKLVCVELNKDKYNVQLCRGNGVCDILPMVDYSDPDVAKELLITISLVASNIDNARRLGVAGICSHMLRILQQHIGNADVMKYCGQALYALCKDKDNIRRFVEYPNYAELLLDVVNRYEENSEVLPGLLTAISNFTMTIATYELLKELGFPVTVMKIMKRFPNHLEILTSSSFILVNFWSNTKKLSQVLKSQDFYRTLIDLTLLHHDKPLLIRRTIRLLKYRAAKEDQSKYLGTLGVCKAATKSLKSLIDNPNRVVIQIATALRNISNNQANIKLLVVEGCIELIMEACLKHIDNGSIVYPLVATLVNIASIMPKYMDILIQHDVYSLLLHALEIHYADRTMMFNSFIDGLLTFQSNAQLAVKFQSKEFNAALHNMYLHYQQLEDSEMMDKVQPVSEKLMM